MGDAAESGRAALASLDAALAAGPHDSAPLYADATERLCAMRDAVIARGPSGQASLPVINGLISSTMSGHFPLGAVPRPLLIKAREALAKLLSKITD